MSTRRTLRDMTADLSWVEVLFGLIIVLCIVAVGWVLLHYDSDGTHSWRGGSGPSTVCYYESRPETASDGKTVIPVQYTVCRDAR